MDNFFENAYEIANLDEDWWSIVGFDNLQNFNAEALNKLQWLIDSGLKNTHKILDVGCGTGLLASPCETFLTENAKYVGMDVSAKAIEFCRKKFTKKNFSFMVNKQTEIPTKEKFDCIAFYSVLTHCYPSESVELLKQAKSLLEPNGIVVFDVFLDVFAKELNLTREAIGISFRELSTIVEEACFNRIIPIGTGPTSMGWPRYLFCGK